jgi:hypothetical protein
MKNQILLLGFSFLLLVCSCSIYKDVPHSENVNVIDFNKYSDKGFLFTIDEKYIGKYKSCGLIEVELFPEVKNQVGENYDKNKYISVDLYLIEIISIDQVFDLIYEKAKSIGADAIVNLKISKEENPHILKTHMAYNFCDGYSISGFAIKRLD